MPAAIVAVVITITIAVTPAFAPVMVARPFIPVTIATVIPVTPWRILQKIHRLATGRVARAVPGPVLRVAWRYVHVDGRSRHVHSRRSDHHWLLIQQHGRRPATDVHPAIDARSDLPTHRRIHVALRMGRTSSPAHRHGRTQAGDQAARAIREQVIQRAVFHHGVSFKQGILRQHDCPSFVFSNIGTLRDASLQKRCKHRCRPARRSAGLPG